MDQSGDFKNPVVLKVKLKLPVQQQVNDEPPPPLAVTLQEIWTQSRTRWEDLEAGER